jgi:hypothetical protein
VAKSCGESVHSEQNNNVSQSSGTFSSHYYSESEAYTRYPNLEQIGEKIGSQEQYK